MVFFKNMDFGKWFIVENIVALILLIIGVVWLIVTLIYNSKVNAIYKWPRVQATIVYTYISSTENSGNNILNTHYTHNQFSNEDLDKAIYIPHIIYQYNINGTNYQSNRITFGEPKKYNAIDIQAIMSTFTPGTHVLIYYNPNNPYESYIYNGTTSATGIIWGVIFILLALILVYYANVMKHKKQGETHK